MILLGHHLVPLDDCPDGSKSLKRKDNGDPVISANVSAVIMPENYVADQHMELKQAADTEKRVFVIFGDQVLPYSGAPNAITVPCADVDGLSTPLTPRSSSSSPERADRTIGCVC